MMRHTLTNGLLALIAATAMIGCGSTAEEDTGPVKIDDTKSGLAVLGNGENSADAVEIETIASGEQGLDGPRDLEFNPQSPDQLWIVNRNDNSTVVVTNPGTEEQSSEKYSGPGSTHFQAKPAALAFGDNGNLATAQQEDEITQPSTPADFMGPTLWPSDLETFDGGHHGHLDMLHNSPLSSGVAWDEGNAYWIFDGYHGSITRYDFNSDHGPGGSDHTDGIVRRYVDDQLSVVEGVVAHVAMDHESELLYIADTGNNRIAVLETDTGETGDTISPNYDGSDQRHVNDAVLRTLIQGSVFDMAQPAGLELHDDLLYVSDNGTSTIFAFEKDGTLVDSLNLSDTIPAGAMMGMALDAEGRIYVANSEDNTIHRIAPKGN